MSDLIVRRATAAPSRWTFTIKPIRELVLRYVGDGVGWCDPYAGTSRLAQYTNDLDESQDTTHHGDALDFALWLPFDLAGCLYDPPYSYRQVAEHYKAARRKVTRLDTSYNYYRRTMNAIAPKIKTGGIAISCGWNSNGFGRKCGFEKIEVLVVAHGLHHNDTIVVVERKL